MSYELYHPREFIYEIVVTVSTKQVYQAMNKLGIMVMSK